MFKKLVLAATLLLGGGHIFAQHHGSEQHGIDYRGHNSYQYRPDGGKFVERRGWYHQRPYYGGLRVYRGVNIYPCSQFDFDAGMCYPYDYAYYPQYYNGFNIGVHIR